jgi:hypothetical protein
MQTTTGTPKRGRISTGKAMTSTERQRASRARRKAESFETFLPVHISMLLSGQASQALSMLTNSDTSQKAIIEELLIEAYAKMKA